MILELILPLVNGALRRIDGMDKTGRHWLINDVLNVVVRAFPALMGTVLFLSLYSPVSLEFWILPVAFGIGISIAMQRGFDGWTEFSLRQITQYLPAIISYLMCVVISWELALIGVACCLLAGLTHPVLSRSGIKSYTWYAEFFVGYLLLVPFAVY